MFDFAAPIPQHNAAASSSISAAQHTNGASADDDWDFSSALPEDNLPSATSLVVSSKEVEIVFDVSRRKTEDAIIDVVAKFSNKSPNPITEYTFQIAVTKVSYLDQPPLSVLELLMLNTQAFTLKLTPQSGRKLQPFQKNGITQPIEIHGVAKGQSSSVKVRWKASYKAAGDLRQEQGEVPPLMIS